MIPNCILSNISLCLDSDLQDEGLVPNPADMQKEKVQHKRKKRTNDPFENESKRTKRQMAIEASNIKKNN